MTSELSNEYVFNNQTIDSACEQSIEFENSMEDNFDKATALQKLKCLYAADCTFFLQDFVKLSYLIRKFTLTFNDLSLSESGKESDSTLVDKIYKQLKEGNNLDSAAGQDMLYFLCLSLKYLTKNSQPEASANPLTICYIVHLTRIYDSHRLKNELLALLTYVIEASDVILSTDVITELEELILNFPEVNLEYKALLFNKLEANKAIKKPTTVSKKMSDEARRPMATRNVKRMQHAVTKNSQTVRSKQESKSSEEIDFKRLNLNDFTKNRNKRQKSNEVLEKTEAIVMTEGNDRRFWRNTWEEVGNLSSLVSQGEALKNNDKDVYLPTIFLDTGTHFLPPKIVVKHRLNEEWKTIRGSGLLLAVQFPNSIRDSNIYSFFINRICAFIFWKASGKQRLNDNTIDKLLQCVTNFESLLSVLMLRSDYVQMFADQMWLMRSQLKKITSPDIIVRFVETVMKKTIEKCVKTFVVFNYEGVQKISFDREQLEKIIITEVNQVRRDAVKAVYNCVVREKKILTGERLKKIESCLDLKEERFEDSEFTDHIFKIVEFAGQWLDSFDYTRVFQTYINQLNGELTVKHIKAILNFINNQARDARRSQELFDDWVTLKLIELLGNSSVYDIEIKEDIMEIINTYLDHEHTEGLSRRNLELMLSNTFDSNCTVLINAALYSLLILSDKVLSLPQDVLKWLVKYVDPLCCTEVDSNFILFILSRAICGERAQQQYFLNECDDLDIVSYKLQSDEIVILADNEETSGQRIRFEKKSKENCDGNNSNQISLLTSRIILKSAKHDVWLSGTTMNNLLFALNSSNADNRQTKIVAAKCLYWASKYMPLGHNNLSHIHDCISSEIYDVSVYSHATYLNECAEVALASDQCLDPIHLENLCSLYLPESLTLGELNFQEEINTNLFRTLLYEAKKQIFNNMEIFLLFETILCLNDQYVAQVLEILIVYSKQYLIPDTTVAIVETVFQLHEYAESAFLVLQNVIYSEQSVITSKTLNIFVDNLYTSTDSRQRFTSFKLLEKVIQHQEVVDDIFYKLELAKAGFALNHHIQSVNAIDKKPAIIEFILRQTENGKKLPIDTTMALEKNVIDKGVLKIFCNVSRNKQVISLTLLQALIDMFDPASSHQTDNNIILLGIFENIAKNNQTLPGHLLDKLQQAFYEKYLERRVLPVFIFLCQKGEQLSKSVNDKLLDLLMHEEDIGLKQKMLSALGTLIEVNKMQIASYQTNINQILIKEIRSDNFIIQKSCITAIGKLVMITKQIDDKLLHVLVEVGTKINCNNEIKTEIRLLFDENKCLIHNESYREKIWLANLNFVSNEDLLYQLTALVNTEAGLLEQNYNQLQNIIDKDDSKLQMEALNLLQKSKITSKVTDSLLESVAILYESTMLDDLRTSCIELFNKVSEEGKILPIHAHRVWSEKINRDVNIRTIFRSKVYEELKFDFQLDDNRITEMLRTLKTTDQILDIKTLPDFILSIVQGNLDYFENQQFVLLIENCVMKQQIIIVEIVLPFYCRIIKEKKHHQLENCLKALTRLIYENFKHLQCSNDFLAQLVEAMCCATKYVRLPDECLQFLESNLENKSEIIRGYSMRTLTITSKDDRYEKSIMFNNWCDKVLENLMTNVKVKIEKSEDFLDLLEIIVSVKFLDFKVFDKKEKETWKRDLLISNLFHSFNNNSMEHSFLNHWRLVENTFTYHKSVEILLMIQMSHFVSIDEIIELISIMPDISYDEIVYMISINRPAPFREFKQEWFMKKIESHLKNADKCYLKTKVKKICSQLNTNFIGKIVCSIKSIDDLRAFEDLVDFCLGENIRLNDMIFETVNLNDLKCSLEAMCLCNHVESRPVSVNEEGRVLKLFHNLLNKGCSFIQLKEIVSCFNQQKYATKFISLRDIMSIIDEYRLSSSANLNKCKQILMKTESLVESIRKLNRLAIETYLQLEGKMYYSSELLVELKNLNPLNDSLKNYINRPIGSLEYQFKKVKDDNLKMDDKTEDIEISISCWNEKQISLWSKKIRDTQMIFQDYEVIAVIKRANFLTTGQTLTDTQILCSLIALESEKNEKKEVKGTLLEFATGEGKSTIICILAIINSLRGKQVHVITSSPVLAERDAKQKTELFKMFNLTCSDNTDKTVYVKGIKNCYKSDIIFGEVSQFQFDILRHIYSQLGTMGDNRCVTAIVDEVDSVLIDDCTKIARLSSTVAGMDHFQAIYVHIWLHLISIKDQYILCNNKWYFIDGKIGFENGKLTLEIQGDLDNNSRFPTKIPDLQTYLLSYSNNTKQIRLVQSIRNDLVESIEKYLDNTVKEQIVYNPNNLKKFFEMQKSKWINNAIEALHYEIDVDYVVQDGQIKPVDYCTSGIVQSSSNWGDGLHQFLQLKHNLKMTVETFTTNFLSNIGFINKYEQLYGLTGTLGSESDISFLKKFYKVEAIKIPQRREKQFCKLEPHIVQGETYWLKEISSTVMLEIKKERGILVICETIEYANRISKILEGKLRPGAVKLYTMNNMNQEKNVEKILPGQVIVATNLAGRGMHIQTDEIETSGGLHVILTFRPRNQRVEDQAFGRTARQGKRGTGIMILNSHSYDLTDSNLLKDCEEKELKWIQDKDKLFDTFCTFLNEKIRVAIRKEHCSLFTKVRRGFTDVQPTVYESNVIAAAEEQWAGFLYSLDKNTNLEDAVDKCNAFFNQLQNDFENDRLIKNPYYFTCIANDIIANEWSIRDAPKVKRALEYFERAIELQDKSKNEECGNKSGSDGVGNCDPDKSKAEASIKVFDDCSSQTIGESETVYNGSGAAYCGVAWCLITLKKENYKEKALKSFEKAMLSVSNEKTYLMHVQFLLQNTQGGFVESNLYKQLISKATILGSYLNGIQGCIEAIKRSLRLIDIVAIKRYKDSENVLKEIKYFNDSRRQEKCIETYTEDQRNVLEEIKYFNEQRRHVFDNHSLNLRGDESYSLVFNHLTVTDDLYKIDQALNTLKHAFDKSIIDKETDADVQSEACETAAVDPDHKQEKKSTVTQKITTLLKRKKKNCLSEKSYSGIRISLKHVDMHSVSSSLFNANIEFKELTRESAIIRLKEIRTNLDAATKLIPEDIRETFSSVAERFYTPKPFSSNLTMSSIVDPKICIQVKCKTINDMIERIEKQTINDESLRFSAVIKDANKLFKSMNDYKAPIKLEIEFVDLNQDTMKQKLKSIGATSIDIKFVLNKLNLSKLFTENEKLKSGILGTTDPDVFEKVSRDELLKRVNELKTDESPCFVKLESLDLDQARNLLESEDYFPETEKTLFTATFKDVANFYDSNLDNGQGNIYFDSINYSTAKMVIEVLRQENFEFSLEFKSLNKDQVEYIVQNASLKSEEIDIRKVKKLSDLYMKCAVPSLELAEFAAKGIEYIIEINEKQFVPWRSIAVVAGLATLQIIIGGILVHTGFGSTVGLGLITEGIPDVVTAFRTYRNRQFDWRGYCRQKAISLIISAATMGYSAFKNGIQNAAMGIETVTAEAGREVLEQATTQIISNNKAMGQTLLATGNNLKSLTLKYVGLKAGEEIVKESAYIGIQNLSKMSLDKLFKSKIKEIIQSNLRASFCNTELMSLLRKMYAIDKITNSNMLKSRVESIVANTLHPQQTFIGRHLPPAALSLAQAILLDPNIVGNTIAGVSPGIGFVGGLYFLVGEKIVPLVDNVVNDLRAKLRLFDRNYMTIHQVLSRTKSINKDNARDLVIKLKELQIIDEFDNFIMTHSDVCEDFDELKIKIDNFVSNWTKNKTVFLKGLNNSSSSLEDDVNKSIDFINDFYNNFIRVDFEAFSMIVASISDTLTEQLIMNIDSSLVELASVAVGEATKCLSVRLQHHYLINREQNSDSQNVDQKRYENLKDKKDPTLEELSFINNYSTFRTFSEQINYNARDYCTAYYRQCEMSYFANKENSSVGNIKNHSNVMTEEYSIRERHSVMANDVLFNVSASTDGKSSKKEVRRLCSKDFGQSLLPVHCGHGRKSLSKDGRARYKKYKKSG